jgi:hypothetical protein
VTPRRRPTVHRGGEIVNPSRATVGSDHDGADPAETDVPSDGPDRAPSGDRGGRRRGPSKPLTHRETLTATNAGSMRTVIDLGEAGQMSRRAGRARGDG